MRLCRYIGDKVPDKTDGGRSGNAIFQELAKIVRVSTIVLDPFITIHRAGSTLRTSG